MSGPSTQISNIKSTSSLCPRCYRALEAEVYESDGKVFLRKTCSDHGTFDVLINSDRRFYYQSVGSGCGCAAQSGHCDDIIERSATCIALIEIVESCNLKCPTCYADSPFAPPASHSYLSLDEFWSRVNKVIERKGPLDILQLSGGEPTLHPQFFELLEPVLPDKRIGYTLINTNGVLLAKDEGFMRRLGQLHQQYRRFELYLQFDGTQEAGQVSLRGADFRKVREEVIVAAAEYDLPVTLAMTVTPDNISHLGDTLRFAVSHRTLRGICFQPMFGSGRTHPTGSAGTTRDASRLNVADVIHALIDQGNGLLSDRDFTPLPCGDPNCHTIGYLLRRGDQVVPVSHFINFSAVQGFLKDRVDFNIEDLWRCGCESEPLGHILKQLEIGPDDAFRIFIKPFMDAFTYDQDRIDRCCVHVVGEGGKLESFCRHYAMKSAPRPDAKAEEHNFKSEVSDSKSVISLPILSPEPAR